MNFFKRAIPLALAILMILGTMGAAFQSFAAFSPELGEGHKGSNGSTPFTVTVSGTPASAVYTSAGSHKFTVTEPTAGKFKVVYTKSNGSEETVTSDLAATDSFTHGGLEISKTGNWVSGDKVEVIITSKKVDATKEAFISRSRVVRSGQSLDSASATTSITRGSSADFRLIIVDPNFDDASTVLDREVVGNNNLNDAVRYVLNTDSFSEVPRSGRENTAIYRVAGGVGGKLAFQVDFRNMEYSGKGNTMRFNFSYSINGQSYEYSMSQNFPECKEVQFNAPPKDEPDEEEKPLDPLVPHIIVSSYDYGARQVAAGQSFDLDLKFTNTSANYKLNNIIMKISEGEGFTITNSSNSFYLADMESGASISHKVSLQALPGAKAQSYPIKIDFTFQYVANETRKDGTSAESISIPISQPDRFQVNEISVPTMLMVGEEFQLSTTFVNKGKVEVYNVSAELRGANVPGAGQRQFIGNVASGTENSADFYVSPEAEGMMEGEVVITYEDSNMNVREVVKKFTIEVQSYPMPDLPMNPDMPTGPVEETKKELWTKQNILLGLAGLIVAGLTAYLTVVKIKAKRSDLFDETI